jgi:isoquinoline 1-oxidoreductase beta subunit
MDCAGEPAMLTRRGFLTSTAIGALALEAGLGLGRPTSAATPGQAPATARREQQTFTLTVNGATASVVGEAELPLLWALREQLGLKGAKYGCGVGMCGICTVHLDGEPRRACVTPVGETVGKQVTTIEGLAADPAAPMLRAWVAAQVPQCGYCQPGMIMTAAALLADHPAPSDGDIDRAMAGMLCRCGTYRRIRAAIHLAARGGADPETPASQASPSPPDLPHALFQPNPWMRVNADGTVTVVIDRAEMGQGVVTSLATLVAEELEVELAQVRTEFAPADPRYANPLLGAQVTGSSTSIRAAWLPLRQAAAAAREALVAAAAARWGVAASACRTERGEVVDDATGRRLGYAAVAAAAKPPAAKPAAGLKPRERFRLIGKPVPRLDIPLHVTGKSVFGSDVSVPGMLVAVVARGPAFGARVRRYDDARARTVAGVKAVVAIDSGVAVVADRVWPALRGRDLLDIDWDRGPNATLTDADIERRFREAAGRRGSPARNDGDAEAALRNAATRLDADYFTPFLAHATMEPMNCTAEVRADHCDVWVGTQAQTRAQQVAADAAGLPTAAVRIHSTFLGGGFGRRLNQDFVREAVQVSKAVGAPVQVVWTRSDDLRHDFYRPANFTRFGAGLDGSGRVIAWSQRTVGPPMAQGGIDIPYAIPNLRTEQVAEDPVIPSGPWRSVGASQNGFVVESFVDELAHAAGQDPLAFRLALLAKAPRHRRVLELAAEQSGWGTPLPAGRRRGVAVYFSFGSWVAEVAEVSLSEDKRVRVHRVVAAIDCGTVVNPDTVKYQIEGAIVYGLTAALQGEITLRGGGVVEDGFADYPLLTMAEMPEVEVHLVASDEPPGGVGEPGLPPIAPAVANALFAATGRRLRRLPLKLA